MPKVVVTKPFIYRTTWVIVGTELDVSGPTAEKLERRGLARSKKIIVVGVGASEEEPKRGRKRKRSSD